MSQATFTSPRASKTYYTVNVRLLVGTMIAALIIGAGGFAWYRYRMSENSAALLERAELLESTADTIEDPDEKVSKWREATTYYQRYLLVDPENTDVLLKLIAALDRGEPSYGKLRSLNDLLYRTIGRLPEDHTETAKLRLMLAENLLKLQSWEEAKLEAEKLAQSAPPDLALKARKVVAISKLRRLDFDHTISATDTLKELVSVADELPADHELALTTAVAVRSRPDDVPSESGSAADLADRLIDQTVAAQPQDVDALMARYQYRRVYSLPGAEEDLASALKIEPTNGDVLLASAVAKITPQSSPEELSAANAQLRSIIAEEPEDPRASRVLVEVLKLQGQPREAIALQQDIVRLADEKFVDQLTLATLQLEAGETDDAKQTLQLLERDGKTFLARLDATQREAFEKRLGLLKARMNLVQGNPIAAVNELKAIYLKEATSDGEPSSEWMMAGRLLAGIYEQQGAWDQAGVYWDALLEAVPHNPNVVVPAVESALRAGNSDRALKVIDQFGRPAQLTEELLVLRVRALLMQEMQRAPEARNWNEFDRSLEESLAKAADRHELLFAKVERLATEPDGKAQILEALKAGEERFAENADFWRRAALKYGSLGAAADQGRALSRYRELESSPVQVALIEAIGLVQQGKVKEADQLLATTAADLPATERTPLYVRRVEMLGQGGQLASASKVAEEALQAEPDNSRLLRLAGELAAATGDWASAEKWEQKLAAATHDGPDSQLLKAKRLLANYEKLSGDDRQELANTINEVRSERPEWVEIISLAAHWAELSGDQRQAIEDYRLAVALGDRRQFTLQQLVTLLYGLNRIDEADDYLALLETDQGAAEFVNAVGIEIARKQGWKEAIVAAEASVKRHPQDAARRIYLANLLMANGEPRKAEDVLRQASTDLPGDARVWLGLVTYLAKSGRQSDAAEIIAAIGSSSQISPEERSYLQGQAYELVGDNAAAAKSYQAAVEQDPENVQLRLRFARSLRSRSISEAVAEYERILQMDPANREVPRELAILLASTGNPDDWTRASQLLEQTDAASGTASSQVLRALLLSQQGRTRAERIAKSQAARELLEQHLQAAPPAEATMVRLMLAQLLEQEALLSGQAAPLDTALDHLQRVVKGESSTIEQRSRLIEFLLRNADKAKDKDAFLNAAGEQIEKLREDIPSDDVGAQALGVALAAQLSKAKGSTEEANELVEGFAKEHAPDEADSGDLPTLLTVGKLYTAVGNHAAAEGIYRQVMQIAPNGYLLVAQSLLEQGKRREAAQLCLDLAPEGLSPEMAQTLASIMTSTEGTEGLDFPEAEAALEATLAKYPTIPGLLQADAIRKASLGDYDAAITAFRKLVQIDPQNSLALNNLATLLAENPKLREEALSVVNQAITLAGRQASLLDTKGTILLKLSRPDEAIVDLEEATAGGQADARYYLHLAAAYQLAGRRDEALKMLEEAVGFGLEKFLLTGDDRELLEELNSLKQQPATVGDST